MQDVDNLTTRNAHVRRHTHWHSAMVPAFHLSYLSTAGRLSLYNLINRVFILTLTREKQRVMKKRAFTSVQITANTPWSRHLGCVCVFVRKTWWGVSTVRTTTHTLPRRPHVTQAQPWSWQVCDHLRNDKRNWEIYKWQVKINIYSTTPCECNLLCSLTMYCMSGSFSFPVHYQWRSSV